MILSRLEEDALWEMLFTAAPAQRRVFEPSSLAIDKEEKFSFMPGVARGGRETDPYPVLAIGVETAPWRVFAATSFLFPI
ncbi:MULTISPECIES: hypothetical protein [unclassified Rhizobium]|uniref:hypothetical protein n=1 Tax=unclassified Rhizobium TaxID=2613769 RepID=UPI000F742D11|nr:MULTISPECIES: hypothetical protein [unclassified Rhizobium]